VTDTIQQAQHHLRALAGDDAVLHEDQAAAITTLVDERARALVVQRTGWGKSAVYFIATRLLRDRGAGPTLIVSPLLVSPGQLNHPRFRTQILGCTAPSGTADRLVAGHR
jgi:ATP-dependent DNA helicase RecQ